AGCVPALIVVNCVILGRAEMFASKNGPFLATLDGIGMGIGFTLTLTIMAIIREVFGAGTCFGIQVLPEGTAFTIIASPPGGFFVFGLMMAATTAISTPRKPKEKPEDPAPAVEGGEA
ncbi:MAG: Rnf-Nqr domain containing protein, partial [Eubacteriales bacterium]